MQHFIYRIKRSLRSKGILGWSLLFPLFLGLMFKFMFGNMGTVEQFSEVAVGIVEEQENETFVTMMQEMETEDGISMFDVTKYSDEKAAKDALLEEEIYAYIIVAEDDFSLMIREMDIYTTFIKSFVDQYKQNVTLIETVARENPLQLEALVEGLFTDSSIGISQIDLKGQDKSPYTQYFYSLLAMSCLMAAMVGVGTCSDLQANASAVGARRNVAPTAKMRMFGIEMLADFFLYCVLMLIVLLVVMYVYGQDFGDNFGLILLTTMIGSFNGLAVGFFIGTWAKGSAAKRDALSVTFFMVSAFLGGLQMAELPYMIEQKCPVINRINPATLIVNAYKSIAVFGDVSQYMVNIISLFAIAVLFMVLSVAKMRRTRYASL